MGRIDSSHQEKRSLRLCMDYRKLNAVTKRDQFPMPRIDKGFDIMAGSQYFSTHVLWSGYWQMELEANSKEKTAFAIPSGLCDLETMPFGLMDAPASFQRLMNQVLRDLIPTQCVVSISVLSNSGALYLASYTIISGGTMNFN